MTFVFHNFLILLGNLFTFTIMGIFIVLVRRVCCTAQLLWFNWMIEQRRWLRLETLCFIIPKILCINYQSFEQKHNKCLNYSWGTVFKTKNKFSVSLLSSGPYMGELSLIWSHTKSDPGVWLKPNHCSWLMCYNSYVSDLTDFENVIGKSLTLC